MKTCFSMYFLFLGMKTGVCRFQMDEGKGPAISKCKREMQILNVNPFYDLMPWDSNHKHLQWEWVSKIIQRASIPMSYREGFCLHVHLFVYFENLITGKHKLQLPYWLLEESNKGHICFLFNDPCNQSNIHSKKTKTVRSWNGSTANSFKWI